MTKEQLDKVLKELDKMDIPYEFKMVDNETEEAKILLNNTYVRVSSNLIFNLLLGDEK